jgi:hypothetical protein
VPKLPFHCELGTGLWPTSTDETDFAGVIRFSGRLRLLAGGRSLNDALKLACELDLGRFDDLDLRNERRRSEACFLAFALVKRALAGGV